MKIFGKIEKVPNDAKCHLQLRLPAKLDGRRKCFDLSKIISCLEWFFALLFSARFVFCIFLLRIFHLSEKGPPVVRSPSQVIMVPCVLGWGGAFSLKEFLWHKLCLFQRWIIISIIVLAQSNSFSWALAMQQKSI